MKKILTFLTILLILVGCSTPTNNEDTTVAVVAGVREDNKYEDFNQYLFTELGLAYTPTFIITDTSGKITYFNDGEVTAEGFKDILNDIKNNSVEVSEDYMPNLGKTLMKTDFIKDNVVNVIEIVWTNCGHCKVQITENNPAILAENPNIHFVEYFPMDVMSDVENFIKE